MTMLSAIKNELATIHVSMTGQTNRSHFSYGIFAIDNPAIRIAEVGNR